MRNLRLLQTGRRSRVQVLSSLVEACSLESGFQQAGNGGQHTYDLPETSVRFGIPGQRQSFVWEFQTTSTMTTPRPDSRTDLAI